ncbi:Uma2 family endonuclease [Pseudonocardia ailaonensis]|uniref:Uma2 family endonuclease n=1 Tax=Pseudonocardia ailaonensis TaxID=367279 RepID=UPI0031DEBFC0
MSDFRALGEPDSGYVELVEGNLVMAASPRPRHGRATMILGSYLDSVLPAELVVIPDIDVDLQLVEPEGPGTVRRPDLAVVTTAAYERAERENELLRARDVVLAVEIASPGSVRTDHVAKRSEYADAGIPHYWIVDLEERVTLTACHLGGEFGYVDAGPAAGVVAVTEPFVAEIDLDRLL